MSYLDSTQDELQVAKSARIFLLSNVSEISYYWPELEKCLDETRDLWCESFTKDSILARAIAGRVQIWVVCRNDVLDLAFMTQAYQTDVMKILQVFWMFGRDLSNVLELISLVLDKYAAQIEAERLEVVGRPAFVRMLRSLGADFQYVTCGRNVRPITRN